MISRSTDLTHERLMDAWFTIHDIIYTPQTSAASVAILMEARSIIAERAKEVLDAKMMHMEDVAMECADMVQNLKEHSGRAESER